MSGVDKVYRAATEASAGKPRTKATPQTSRCIDEKINLVDAAFKVVSLASVGGGHHSAKPFGITGEHRFSRFTHSLILSDDVPAPAKAFGRQFMFTRLQL